MSEQKDGLAQCGVINPLKWNDVYSHREDGGTDLIGWEADTGFGVYYGIDEYWASDSHGWELCLDYEKLGDFDDPDQAKAFAQKHYAERISSAILTPAACSDLSCAADFLDNIEVDENGKCEWTAVANAQTHIRGALRCWAPNEIAALKHDIERLTETNTQLLAQVENARAAIEPFSKLVAAMYESGHCGGASPEDWPDTWHVGIEGRDRKGNIYVPQQWGGSLTVGDFRKLSTALTSTMREGGNV